MIRSFLSFLAICFWVTLCFGGTILGLITWPMVIQEYAYIGMPLTRGEILGTGIVLIASWPMFGSYGLWMHLDGMRPKPR